MAKIRNIMLALSIVFMTLMTACGMDKLPEGFDEKEVNAAADMVVERLSDKNYNGVVELFSEEMASQLGADAIEEAVGKTIDDLGAFEKITSRAVSGQTLDNGKKYAVVVLVCKYENGNATYTISIDEDGKIAGLYMK